MKSPTTRRPAVRRRARPLLSAGPVVGAPTALAPAPAADDITVSYDTLRSGRDPNEPGLIPSSMRAGDRRPAARRSGLPRHRRREAVLADLITVTRLEPA